MTRGVLHNVIIGINLAAVAVLSSYALVGFYDQNNTQNGQVLAAQNTTVENFEYSNPLLADTAAIIQSERDNLGMRPLAQSERLDLIAAERAASMQNDRYYAHREPTGTDFSDRLKQQGSDYSFACENLNILEKPDAQNFVSTWLASPAHSDCMTHASHTHAGYATTEISFGAGQPSQTIIVAIYANLR